MVFSSSIRLQILARTAVQEAARLIGVYRLCSQHVPTLPFLHTSETSGVFTNFYLHQQLLIMPSIHEGMSFFRVQWAAQA